MDTLDILINIRKIVRSINLESKKIQKDFDISIPQLLCLSHLSRCPNYQSTLRDFMDLLSLNSSTITGIINRLEKKGLVARLPKEGDKRVTWVALTAKGLKLVESSPNVLHEQLSAKIKTLPEPTQQMIKESLEIIISALNISELEASPIITMDDPLDNPSHTSAD